MISSKSWKIMKNNIFKINSRTFGWCLGIITLHYFQISQYLCEEVGGGEEKVRIFGVVVRYWQTSLIISIQSSGHLEHLFLDHWTRKVRNLARWPPWGLTLQILKFVIVTLSALCTNLHLTYYQAQGETQLWYRQTDRGRLRDTGALVELRLRS